MFFDGRQQTGDVTADICVIGAGASGITLALSLLEMGRDVLLLESGGLARDPALQALNKARHVGIVSDLPEGNRIRGFGGTTQIWGGWCRPLDEADFAARSWVPYSGWPFHRDALAADYARAHQLFGITQPQYDPAYQCGPKQEPPCEVYSGRCFENVVFHVSDTQRRLGETYRALFETAPKLSVYLNSTAVALESNATASAVTGVRVKTLEGHAWRVQAKHVVLAADTIQNARLLLCSTDVAPAGLGNDRGLVGRYFMQHPVFEDAMLLAFSHRILRQVARGENHRAVATALRAEAAREHQMLNYHFLLHDAIAGGERTVRRFFGALRDDLFGSQPSYEHRSFDHSVTSFTTEVARSNPVDAADSAALCPVMQRAEQAPNPDSRIRLDTTRDALGMPHVTIDWQLTELDIHTFTRAPQLLGHELGERGIGRMKHDVVPKPSELINGKSIHGGHHHYGTTRMHDDPAQGVVDANCRVHGIANLYVAGGSVFPTCGYANPTLTIVALASRLARILNQAS